MNKEKRTRPKILSLHGLLKVMLGEMTPNKKPYYIEQLLPVTKLKALPQINTQTHNPPLMADSLQTLVGRNKTKHDLAAR
jgi:hypothetical protein